MPVVRLEVESLPTYQPPLGASAWDDEASRTAIGPQWRRRGVVLGVLVLAMLASASGTAIAPVGGVVVFVLVVVTVVRGVFAHRDRRRVRRALRSGPWQLVNAVVLADTLGRELSSWEAFFARGHKRGGVHYGDKVVAIIDPGSGNVCGTWLPFTRTHPWPRLDERRWAWFVSEPGGDAAIASIDRTRVVGLRRGPRFVKALHDHAWNVLRDAEIPPAPGGRPVALAFAGVLHPLGEVERWPNRPMTTRARVAIVGSMLAVAAVTGLSDTLAHLDKVDHNAELVENGVEARAEVIGYRSGGRSSSDRISIVILDGPFAGFGGTRSVDRGPKARPGAIVTIFTDPDDVDDLLIVGYDQDVRSTGWILLVSTGVVGGWLWTSHRRAAGRSITG